jgi:hypothetical protein
MKITQAVLLFALFGHTSARLNAGSDGVEQDQRALQNDNDMPLFEDYDAGTDSSGSGPPGSQSNLVGVTDFLLTAADADVLNVLITFKTANGKAKVEQASIQINEKLQLVDMYAAKATAKVVREWALDDDIA